MVASVPFTIGTVLSTDDLWVEGVDGEPLCSSIEVTGNWPDGSVKWCVVRFPLLFRNDSYPQMTLCAGAGSDGNPPTAKMPEVAVQQSADKVTVSDGELGYVFHKSDSSVFPDVYVGGVRCVASQDFDLVCSGSDGSGLQFEKSRFELVSHGAASATLLIGGTVSMPADKKLAVKFRFEVNAGQWLRVVAEVHNPHRARHVDGIWDLGDSGSVGFSEFAIQIKLQHDQRVSWRVEPGSTFKPAEENVSLFQASSGGENWDSPNHINAAGKITSQHRGYRIESAGSEIQTGDRASPELRVEGIEGTVFGFKIRQYWQNFPKCLQIADNSITVGLFPRQHSDDFELQGGERKQHELVFSFGAADAALDWVDQPAVVSVPVADVAAAQVLRYAGCPSCDRYDKVISASHADGNGFLAKREVIDEYGWRNFGDIFADHETLYHESEEIFVSHYNNQYDPIYGFARQYLLTGDHRWYRLLVDLARHVMDIDIYRTDEDRAEYNHGLFWHTDHYKKASTCSHRTYSRDHYPTDWQGDKGGGPGSEHCYTSGLLLYYNITGETDARDAVLGLTAWVRHFYEGTGTLLEACKKLVSEDLRNGIAICRGQPVLRYKYDFDRGVGNYIRALLDSYEITLDHDYVKQAEAVIQGTFGSSDDILVRDLDDIEGTWYYSIFLQEVIRYLDLKRSLGMLDDDFAYARDALLHYARWMTENETPYLSQPDRLEYPNDTWIAQDMRKANVLYAAYRYATEDRDQMLVKARYFRDYVLQELSASDTLHFARIQIIMLQNHGPHGFMDDEADPYPELSELKNENRVQAPCFFTLGSFLRQLLRSWGRTLIKINIKNEIKWVRARAGG